MAEPRYVVILADRDDLHAIAVSQRVAQFGSAGIEPLVFDTLTYPLGSSLTWVFEEESVHAELQVVPAMYAGVGDSSAAKMLERAKPIATLTPDKVVSVWWRRPRPAVQHPDVTQKELREFCQRNNRSALVSFLDMCPGYNDQPAETRANRKPYQMAIARRCGLEIPETAVTSRVEDARVFARSIWERGDEIVYKPLVTGGEYFVQTRLLSPDDLERLDHELRYASVIFQRRILGKDLRVAVVGSSVYCAEWAAENPDPVDVRLELETVKRHHELPEDVRAKLVELHTRLGLAFGVCDLKEEPSGRIVFLETNPSGQWLDLELEAGFPVSETFARVLVEGPDSVAAPKFAPLTEEHLAESMPPPYLLTVPESLRRGSAEK